MGLVVNLTDLLGSPVNGPYAGADRPLPLVSSNGATVTIPLSDSRTGEVQISVYENAAASLAAGAATTCIKMTYVNPKGDAILVLNGFVLQPTTDFDAGTVQATIIDPTLKFKKRYCHWQHVAMALSDGLAVNTYGYDSGVDSFAGVSYYADGLETDYGIPMDGRGLLILLWDCMFGTWDRPGSNSFADSTPGTGMRAGINASTQQPDFVSAIPPNGVSSFTAHSTAGSTSLTSVSSLTGILEYQRIDGPGIPAYCTVVSASGSTIVMSKPATATYTPGTFSTEDAIYCQLSRGDCMYDDIQDIVLASGSFEFDLVPIDADHLGPSGDAWAPGQMAELHIEDQVGTNRSRTQCLTYGGEPVVFVHGEGGCHVTWAPDADQLRTYVTEVGPGGPADPLDQYNKALVFGDTTEVYGLYEDWELAQTAGSGDNEISNALLKNRATAILAAYQTVPNFITLTIDSDAVGTYCYGTDFFVGDIVTVFARRGTVTLGPIDVRILSVTITQIDANGNCQLEISVAPYLTVVSGLGDVET